MTARQRLAFAIASAAGSLGAVAWMFAGSLAGALASLAAGLWCAYELWRDDRRSR